MQASEVAILETHRPGEPLPPTTLSAIKLAVVLPVYNHCKSVGSVIADIAETLADYPLIIVDDGSTDATPSAIAAAIQAADGKMRISVHTHARNQGKGAALQTGFLLARNSGCSHALTMDADGQHNLCDARRLADFARLFPADLIIGDRQIDRHPVPANSRRGRDISRFWLWLQTGEDIPDPQCGLRIYPLPPTAHTRCVAKRFDFETEILARLAWNGCRIRSVPIDCIYFPPGKRVSHFRPCIDTLRGARVNAMLTTLRVLSIPPGKRRRTVKPADISLWKYLSNYHQWRRILNLDGCKPIESSLIAATVGLGIFIGFAPFYGFQTVTAIYMGRRLHLNLPLLILATQVSAPPLTIFTVLVSLMAGNLLLHLQFPALGWSGIGHESVWHLMGNFTADLIVGGLVCGLIAGTAALLLTRLALSQWFKRTAARQVGPAADSVTPQ